MGFCETAAQGSYVGRYASDGQGEVVRPCLCGHDNFDAVLENAFYGRYQCFEIFCECFQFVRSTNLVGGAFGHGRQFKVDVCHHFANPFGMYPENLVVSPCGPVVTCIRNAPFFRSHGAEYQCFFRFITAVDDAFGNAHHQSDSSVIILEAGEVRVVMSAHEHHGIRVFAGDHTHNVVGGAVTFHFAVSVECNSQFVDPFCFHDGAEFIGVGAADGESGRVFGAANILSVEGIRAYFAITPVLCCQNSSGAVEMCFISRVVDPPVFSLVDVYQYQFVCYVQLCQIVFGAFAPVNEGEGLGTFCLECGLVGAQFHSLFCAVRSCVSELCGTEGPCI